MNFEEVINMDIGKIIDMVLESPEMFGEILSPLVAKYKLPIYVICGEILKIMEDYSNADAYFAVIAKIKKKQFDAYINTGFDEKQAMLFMTNQDDRLAELISSAGINLSKQEK